MSATATLGATATVAPVTPERILQFAWGYSVPLIMESAVRHRVFDVLEDGAKTVEEVSAATGASTRGLSAIMNVLVGLQFLSKQPGGRYALTPESSTFLVSSKPTFLGGFLRHTSSDLIPRWLQLNEVVGTGKPVVAVNQEQGGSEFFENFVAALFPMSYPAAHALAEAMAFGDTGDAISVLDLATGSGVWGIVQAQGSGRVRVSAVDWAEVLPVTRKTVERFGLADRFSFIEGDLLTANFGSGHTLATLGHILHSEGEARSRALLEKTYAALASGGTIAIAEFLVNPDRSAPLNGLLFAVNMLVNTENGGTYSFEEIAGWLTDAGFVNARTLAAPGPSPLILATRP